MESWANRLFTFFIQKTKLDAVQKKTMDIINAMLPKQIAKVIITL